MLESEVESRLKDMPGWSLNGEGQIERVFQLKDFAHALLFVSAVGQAAETLNHHPDIDIRWDKVTL